MKKTNPLPKFNKAQLLASSLFSPLEKDHLSALLREDVSYSLSLVKKLQLQDLSRRIS